MSDVIAMPGVSAVPKGLPIALTVTLAVAVPRMAKRRVVIRHLPAVEHEPLAMIPFEPERAIPPVSTPATGAG
jgi:hypothetical protein